MWKRIFFSTANRGETMLFGKYLNRYYLKYWYLFLGVFVVDALVDIIQLFIPIIMGYAITDIQKGIFTIAPTESLTFTYQPNLVWMLLAVCFIAVFIVFGRIGWRLLSAHIGAYIERDLRREMFIHIEKMSVTYYKDKKVGGLLSFFTNDLQSIKTVYTDGIIFLTDLLVLGTLCITFMMIMSYQITLICAVPLVLFIILGGFVGKGESKRYKNASDAFENLSDFTEENLQGFSVVKAYLKEKETVSSFSVLARENEEKNIRYQRYGSLIDLSINSFLNVFWFLMMFLSGYAIIKLDPNFAPNITDVGKLTTFTGFFDSLIWPMIAGGLLINEVSIGHGSYKRIEQILSAKPDIVDDEDSVRTGKLNGDIEYRNLFFTYPDGKGESLNGVSFHVKKGMTVGVLGRTGSGKSTLLSLLPKLYNVKEGMIFIDGKDICKWKKSELRKRIGMVSQDAFLFTGPISENIAFSEDEPGYADLEKVRSAAQFACIDSDIMSFPQGYDTYVGEKGNTLSGGQKQRISIARAFYKNPEVLILDDSLSAVDASTEKEILSNIREYRKGLTTFIIAHRISAIENSDLILVMDEGKVVDQGTHSSLMKSSTLYRDIVRLQELEKEVIK